ncbi:cell wall beta-glucan synthesis family protein [Gigaspora margarita]|uniref:Cell wall beta-glucan synthesis family protein n=1 Tax=Gigaspora margarita TaxID=4874 RepID=A0A8H3WV77_GIGMA|nr:cell wall beta-glucan synthesis family protein [Gigaspora margarita]
MSGSDQEQIYLATIGEVPGSQSTIEYTCPQVDPVGKWYFFRFSDGNTTNDAYTTRFTISDLNGNYPPAPSPAPAPGKNPGQTGKIVSNSTTPAATSSISGSPTSTPASSSNNTPASPNNSNVPTTNTEPSTPSAPSAQKTQSSNANPNNPSVGSSSAKDATDSASSNKTSNKTSGASNSASFLGCAKELVFSVIVGLTLSYLMPSI